MARQSTPCSFVIVFGHPWMTKTEVQSYEIEGDCVSPEWAVNASVKSKGKTLEYDESEWSVTHLPTGSRLVTLPSKKLALIAAVRVTQLGFHAASNDRIKAARELQDQGACVFQRWVETELASGTKKKALEGALAAWSPRTKSSAPKRRPTATKQTSKKTPSPKRARQTSKKSPKAGLDLLAMAQKIRAGNPGELTDVQARRKGQCLW